MATSYKDIKPKIKAKIEKDTNKMAYQIKKNAGHVKTGIKTKICFYFMRMLHTRGWDEADLAYWSKRLGSRKKTLEEQQRSVTLNEIKKLTISAMLVAVAVVLSSFQSRSDRADAFLSNIYATCWLQCF